jgi:L-ascorbate 6-phosphate lactonase
LRGSDLSGVDLVLSSHKHSDHLDPETVPDLMAASRGALLGLPEPLVDHAIGLGLPRNRLIGLVARQTLERPGVSVRAVPSAHEGLDTDERGRHLYLGGLRFYHSGDGVDHDGLAGSIGPAAVDVMFLPINGRDPARGVAGNMTAAEAVTLANRVGPRFVVPHHYDMFTFNTVPVASFEEAARRLAPGIQPVVLRCGGRWEVKR